MRVICEKYQLRGKANFSSSLSGEGNFSCARKLYFSQVPVTLTNGIYLFNSAEYLAVSKTVACKQHCRLEPRNHSVVFFFIIQINPVKFKITSEIVVCHFSLLYRWLEEETWVIQNYICDVINDLKKDFFSRAWYLPSTVVFASIWNSQGHIHLRWGKSGKN